MKFERPASVRWSTVSKALVALIGATGCLAAVAYAASDQAAAPSRTISSAPSRSTARVSARTAPKQFMPRVPKPRIAKFPASGTLSSAAEFRFLDRRPKVGYRCRIDKAKWKACGAQIVYGNLAVGVHRFSVQATAQGLRPSPIARFSWTRGEPKEFSIAPQLAGLAPLYPGDPPQPLPVVLTNPNSEPIFVTSLQVAVSGAPNGCSGAENLQLSAAGASPSTPVIVPAGGSVTLPAQGVAAPTIAMRDLPVSQDACQGAGFPLQFSGEARG